MPPPSSKRTGRRPGASGTREAILDAARRLFADRGYAGATLRAIAAEAGVTPPLVVHFFGSKAGLFVAAVQWPFDPREIVPRVIAGGTESIGERLAGVLLATWDVEADRNAVLTLLRSATSDDRAAALLREFLVGELFAPLTAAVHGREDPLRASVLASQLIGAALVRYVLRIEPLASMPSAAVVELLAPALQRSLTGELPPVT